MAHCSMTKKQLLAFDAMYPAVLTLAEKVALCIAFLDKYGAEK